jgi:hypothetical protein
MVAGLAIALIPNVQKRKSGASPLEGGSMATGPLFVKQIAFIRESSRRLECLLTFFGDFVPVKGV